MTNQTNERETRPASWPLLFSYKSRVFGKGYIAQIELCGRLLAELEVDGVWLYGVNPGAIAVGAKNLSGANVDLHKALTAVFADFAEQAASFTEFESHVHQFFDTTDRDSVSEWDGAVARMRASTTIEAPGGLPILDAVKTRVFIRVAEQSTDSITPDDNRVADGDPVPSQLSVAA